MYSPSSSATVEARSPEPLRLALALALAALIAGSVLWASGARLIQSVLPVTHALVLALDDRFAIVSLETRRDTRDTIVALRLRQTQPLVLGARAHFPPPGWLEVTSPIGSLLVPLLLAFALAAAWPAPMLRRAGAAVLSVVLALLWLPCDLALTLHASAWDVIVSHLEPGRFSPLIDWHAAMQGGGRLISGVVLGAVGIALASIGAQKDRSLD
jgi:hypothetical protein